MTKPDEDEAQDYRDAALTAIRKIRPDVETYTVWTDAGDGRCIGYEQAPGVASYGPGTSNGKYMHTLGRGRTWRAAFEGALRSIAEEQLSNEFKRMTEERVAELLKKIEETP